MPAAFRLHDELGWGGEVTASPGRLSSSHSHGGVGLAQTRAGAWSEQGWMGSPSQKGSEMLRCAGTCSEQFNILCPRDALARQEVELRPCRQR